MIALVMALGGLAALLPRPDPPPEPLAGLIIDRPGIESPMDASIWYCPWSQANAGRDSFFGVAFRGGAIYFPRGNRWGVLAEARYTSFQTGRGGLEGNLGGISFQLGATWQF